MTDTTIGNSRLAGKAARNCATGCTITAALGRVPTQTPIGTQMTLAIAISTMTRASVARPSKKTSADVGKRHAFDGETERRTTRPTAASAPTITLSWNVIQPVLAGGAPAGGAGLTDAARTQRAPPQAPRTAPSAVR